MVKEVRIQIETSDRNLQDELFPNLISKRKRETEIEKGISARFEHITIREAVEFPPLIEFTIILSKEVIIPVALGIASEWLYEKIKNRKIKKIRIGDFEVLIEKEKIKQMLLKEIKEKKPLRIFTIILSIPEISKEELKKSARTLSNRPILFNEKELPFPDNQVSFADFISGEIEATLHIRNEELSYLITNEVPLFAKAKTNVTPYYGNIIFTQLYLSSKIIPSGQKIQYKS